MENPICLNSNTYHGFSLHDAVEGAAAAGLKYIELAAVRDYTEHVMPEMSEDELASVRKLLSDNDITPLGMCGHSNIMTENGRANLVKNFDLAQSLGIKYVVTGTGETHGDENVIEDDTELVQIIRQLSAAAKERGLQLCVETHGASYATGQDIRALAERVGADNFGINYDTGNVILYANVEPYNDLAASVDRVVALHLKDKTGKWDEWNFPAIGDGDTDFSKVFEILRSANNLAPLSIEVEFTSAGPADVNEVHDAVKRSAERVRSLI